MSEYQYYEFTAVDRPLDERELGELRSLSSRARITPTGFVNEYHFGDFRGDPRALMQRYFDAFLYFANWGTHRLMMRLPARLLDLETARRYCVGDAASAWRSGRHVIVDLRSEDEGGDWVENESWMPAIVLARAELAAGDLRALYLAWLLSVQEEELDDDELEPPVPPGLLTLSAPLTSLAGFLRIDENLLAVAAEASAPLAADDHSAADLARWVAALPVEEKNALLLRVAGGDGAGLQAELLRRFRGPVTTVDGSRTAGELLDAADARRTKREQTAAARAAQEHARREREAALAREKRLESLAQREAHAWQRVRAMIDTKKPTEYDNAVALLEDLQAVGERKGNAEDFERRMRELREAHRRKPSLINRLDLAGLTVDG